MDSNRVCIGLVFERKKKKKKKPKFITVSEGMGVREK